MEHDFEEIITKLDAKEKFTHTEKALFILINNTHFFNKCYDMLSIHAHDGVIYEIYDGKKDADIIEENCKNLEIAIGEYAHKQYKAGKYCKVFKDEFCGKWIFTVNTHKGAKNQPHWEQDKKKENEINNEKIIPAVKTNIIYEPKTGRVEIGLFKSRSKTFISNIIEIFGEKMLACKINTTNTPKVYNLQKIQQSIEANGDFYFKNTKDVSIVIDGLIYTQDNLKHTVYKGNYSQEYFLKKAQQYLKGNTLEKVEIVAKYKESTKTKDRQFFIEWCKTNLSHNKLDTKIKNILKESGIQEIIATEIKEAFQYIISNNGLVSIYKAVKQGYEKQAFQLFIDNDFLRVDNDITSLFCENCKTDTMEVNEIHATCTNADCGVSVLLKGVDTNSYKLNIQTLKEKLCEYKDFKKDEKSQEPSYLGYLEYGVSGANKINFHIIENAEDVQNIKKHGNQIVFYIYGEYKKEQEKDLNAFPIIDYLNFESKKSVVCFDKIKMEECKRVYVKNPKATKSQQKSNIYDVAITYAHSINKEEFTCENLYNLVHTKYSTIGSYENFRKRIWVHVRTALQEKGGRKAV